MRLASTAAVTVVPLLPPQPTSIRPRRGTLRSVRKVKRVAHGLTWGRRQRVGLGRAPLPPARHYRPATHQAGMWQALPGARCPALP